MTRRGFIGSAAAFGATGLSALEVRAAGNTPVPWLGLLLHMTDNMWGDWSIPEFRKDPKNLIHGGGTNPAVYFDEANYRKTVDYAVKGGCNLLMLDIGDAVIYPSHPEIAIKGSWAPERLSAEVKRLRKMGLEVVPKLNFSSTHDSWLKDYHKMLTSQKYYEVCSDLIRDICEICDHPKHFHIGMDEETYGHQYKYDFICIRRGELWWHDFNFLVGEVEKNGARPWTWCSTGRNHDPDKFAARLPKSVIAATGLYDEELEGFDFEKLSPKTLNYKCLYTMLALDKAGIEQVPCVSNWLSPTQAKSGMKENAHSTAGVVKFSRERLNPSLLRGFLAAPWSHCVTEGQYRYNCRGFDLLREALAS